MLHVTLLPQHATYRRLFTHLRCLVVDEAHVYCGGFGTHVSLIFSRLWRLVHHYQTLYHERVFSLHVMACSATLANPHEHFNALFPSKSSSSEGDSDSDSLVVITDDTPPSDAKELIMS